MADGDLAKSIDDCDDLCRFKVVDLKKYLARHGEPISGNKKDLIERVKGTKLLEKTDLDAAKRDDERESENRKTDKITTPLGEKYAHPDELSNWHTDFTNHLPELTSKEVYNYFVLKMKAERQLKSKVFYEDRHVHSVEMHSINDSASHCYVRGKVLPSMPTANKNKSPDYSVWIMMSKVTGNIHSAECNCVAGEGEACNHIAALMYAVCDISEKKRDGLLAPTSEKCKWNNPRKRKLSPKKAQDIRFQKQIWGKENKAADISSTSCTREANSGCTPVPNNVKVLNIVNFREKLEKRGANNVGWLKNFMPKDSSTSDEHVCGDIPKLNNISFQFRDNVNLRSPECVGEMNKHFRNLSLTLEQCNKIEFITRNQSVNPLWRQARSERITASNFGHVCKKKESTPPDSLLKTLRGYNPFTSKYTEYGRKHESAARRTYMNKISKEHLNVSVRECGLIVNPKYPYLGASPDGLVHCPHCDESQGLLEIKCPASLERRMKTPSECATDPKFYCYLSSDGSVKLKTDHAYYFQVQGQMALSGRSWCDFVVWTCVGCSIERIKFDEQFWCAMAKTLGQFYKDAFLPELFSSRVARGKDLY